MNKYIKSIGFNVFAVSDADTYIIKDILNNPDSRNVLEKNNKPTYFEYYKYYNDNFGLSIKGFQFQLNDIDLDNIFPFVLTDNFINVSDYEIIEQDDICIMNADIDETGNELSFYLHNYIDYYNNKFSSLMPSINVVGLSLFGKIIFPISRDEKYKLNKQKEEKQYKNLLKKARLGDEKAEKRLLTLSNKRNDFIQKRLKEEDFLSVIDGYLLPIKENIPTYCILGTIIEISKTRNLITKELLYLFMLDIKGLDLEICINSTDLVGIPSIGMRFMGQCSLQGKIFYNKK